MTKSRGMRAARRNAGRSQRPAFLQKLRDESGQVAGIEALPFGVLTFVVGILLVANAWGVVDAKLAATAASREAVRAYVEAPDETAALRRADAAAKSAMAGHGRDPAATDVRVVAARFVRCQPVTYEVRYRVPAIRLPWIGGYGSGFVVRARHTEVVDPHRSGDAIGDGRCG